MAEFIVDKDFHPDVRDTENLSGARIVNIGVITHTQWNHVGEKTIIGFAQMAKKKLMGD